MKHVEHTPYPMRINKYLAHHGFATRRGADALVISGKVTINGDVAVLGSKVHKGDTVHVRGTSRQRAPVYFAYNKPKGVVTHGAQKGERDIAYMLRQMKDVPPVFPVGRLDKNSYGLILLTNDGRIVEPLLSPKYPHEKEYRVKVNERLRSDFAKKMSAPMDIGGYLTKPCKVKRMDAHTFSITLTEGKHHQIKRMCNALGYTVNALGRMRIMNIHLASLRPNTLRPIQGDELTSLLTSLHVPQQPSDTLPHPKRGK